MEVTWSSGGWMARKHSEPNLNMTEEWIEKTTVEMNRYSEILERNAEGTHSKEIYFWESAPCKRPSLAYLTCYHVQDFLLVHVLHVIMEVASLTPSLKLNLGIIGDSKPPLLPIIKQAPIDDLEHYLNAGRVG
jgi:hypothetical protein